MYKSLILGVFGKGGVGKTTVSLALALSLKKAVVITTDPYPGLKELLPNPPNGIELVEISYEHLKQEWKKEFGKEAYELFRGVADVDEEFIEYLSSAPGLVEQYAVYRVMKERDRGHVVIWDTQAAPGAMSLIKAELEFYNHLNKAIFYWGKLKKLLSRDVNLEKIIKKWRDVAEFTLNSLKDTRTVIVANEDKLSLKVAESIANELKEFTDFRGFILNKLKSTKPIQLSGEVLAKIPELDNPSPESVSRFISPKLLDLLLR
ncbi:chromosome partitioning ATPase [Pyrobaculum neutrophilum]|uniref:ATPase involved in chromosome partitioning-like protein n=1 Tax=Pyrobaculum neutrophilum (strain DSM 2338 / JCM 9278 / NBRC 100436 / V24Sta) TaxID=444157 RepID=B1Y8Z4_PYRNV|nr:chromosome partitioning ATPase [Pyrobaculum neutrophilum]ACB40223.1 ATPase involved in chromosome partitioning-like protein [Pyrobaculum neutrophilum V24Sta]